MTSWDNLETYLARLVKSVGGTAYVLQDSAGQHLAPRLPQFDEDALKDALAARDSAAAGGDPERARELRTRVVFHALLASGWRGAERLRARAAGERAEDLLRDFEKITGLMERFKQHADALENGVGANFVIRGPGKRYIHRAADLPFMAERLLSSYLLIVAFDSVDALDGGGTLMTLERARSTLCDMLGDLPPDGGGDRALSNANRLA